MTDTPKVEPLSAEELERWQSICSVASDAVLVSSCKREVIAVARLLATISHWQTRAVEAERERDEARRRCMDILDAVEQGTFPHERR